jgi:hypothetical protein
MWHFCELFRSAQNCINVWEVFTKAANRAKRAEVAFALEKGLALTYTAGPPGRRMS